MSERAIPPFPSRRETLLLAALAAIGSGAALVARPQERPAEPRLVHRAGVAFGTTVSIALVDDGRPRRALDAAFEDGFAAIRAVQKAADLFDPSSELSRLNRDGRIARPSPDLARLVDHALALARTSEGAFDPTVQPIWEAWAAADGRPSEAALAAARARVDHTAVRVSPGEIAYARRDVAMTLNALAQGHATDRVAAVLAAHGLTRAFLDTGELGALGTRPGGRAWRVAVADPHAEGDALGRIDLSAPCFVATSADDRTVWTADHSEHHIVEPWSGHSPRELSEVVVVARSGLVADGLSTTLMVTGREKGGGLLDRTPGTAALFVAKSGAVATAGAFPPVSSSA